MLLSLADKIEVWGMVGCFTGPAHQGAKSIDDLCLSPQAWGRQERTFPKKCLWKGI